MEILYPYSWWKKINLAASRLTMETQVSDTIKGDIRQAAESSAALAKTATPITAESSTRSWKAIAPVAVAVILALLPAPSGLPQHAWCYFSVFAGVIVGLVLEPLPGAAVAVIGLTLVTILAPYMLFSPQELSKPGFHPPSSAFTWALSGYSNSTVWLILGAFMLALGYVRTGLGKRIALLLVKLMGKHTLLLGYGVTPVILLTGISIPGIPVKGFALLLCMELGIMGIITPFADAAAPFMPIAVTCRLRTSGVSVRFSELSSSSCFSPSACLGHRFCGGSNAL